VRSARFIKQVVGRRTIAACAEEFMRAIALATVATTSLRRHSVSFAAVAVTAIEHVRPTNATTISVAGETRTSLSTDEPARGSRYFS
jgi:hypothetical protein